MNRLALNFGRKISMATIFAGLLVLVVLTANAQDNDDPPAEAGRISSISGTVSVQPVGSQDWGQAYPNLTLGPGDRIFTDSDGRAEIQVGQSYLRVGPNSDVSLVEDSQFNINFGVAQGSVHLHSYSLWPRQLMGVSTPNGNIEFQKAGDLRVDVYPTDGATVFTNYGEFADVTAAGEYRQQLDNGQSLQLSGSNPVYPQWLQPAGADDLDSWSQQRDQQIARANSYQYVSPDVPGAADLDAYGEWQPETEYGPVWFPRNVSSDWAPYHYGHWVNHAPWGWIWVGDEAWGYAPYHYGRWVSYRGRWGWIPGPRTVRPVYSPALVVFAGGVSFGGSGVSVWFPLGPGEAYRPWYRCSPRYIDRVNISNIRESRNVHVQNTYVNVVNVTNITYVNQSRGATAMRHEDFASGRDARNSAVRVDPRQMEHARPIQRPEPAPTQRSVVSRPVAQPVRVSSERPRLINQQGQQIVAKPGATPVAAPVRPTQAPKPIPGRTVIASPAHPGNPAGRPNPPAQGRQDQNPNQPANANQGGQPRPGQQVPGQPAAGRPVPPNAGQQERNPSQPAAVNPGGQPRPTPQQPVQPAGRPNQPNRPELNPNQPAATLPNGQPRPTPQQPERQDQRQAPPNANQQDRNPDQSPATLPNGKPRPTPQQPERQDQRQSPPNANQQERNPNQPPATLPNSQPRPTPQQPGRQDQRPAPPNANQQDRNPNQPSATLPNGQPRPSPQQPERQDQRPTPPNANQQERNPNQPSSANPGGQPRPMPQQPVRPEQRPMPPNSVPQERNQNQPPAVRQNPQPPAQPVQPPVQRQETRPMPSPQNRPEARPEPQQNRPEARPIPPAQNRPESRPEARPNPSQQNRPETRPAPPPQSRPEAHPAPPHQQEQPQKNEKKKDEKKPQ